MSIYVQQFGNAWSCTVTADAFDTANADTVALASAQALPTSYEILGWIPGSEWRRVDVGFRRDVAIGRRQWCIPVDALTDVARECERLNRRARRTGTDAITVEIIRDVTVKVSADTAIACKLVRLEGPRPAIAGWTFAAKIEHLGDDGNIVSRAPVFDGEIPPHYREARGNCEHCGHARQRRTTFVLRNDVTGQWKQVGRSCLADFLGGHNPEFALETLDIFARLCATADGAEESNAREGRAKTLIRLETLLAHAAGAIASCGGQYRSRKIAERDGGSTTGAITIGGMFPPVREDAYIPTEADCVKARAVLAWWKEHAETLTGDTVSDYEHNLKVVLAQDWIARRHVGIAVSVYAAHARAMNERQQYLDRAASVHFGEIGKRETFQARLVRRTSYDGNFGVTWIHEFDVGGNVAVWFGSSHVFAEVGQTGWIKATVKAHGERNGVKQTTLARVTEADEPKPKRARKRAA
jgi:hypothetical protein